MKSLSTNSEIGTIPIPTLKAVEMFGGLSCKSVERFVQYCREDPNYSHHMVIRNDATLALELLPNRSVRLGFASLPYGDLIDYAPDDEPPSDCEFGGEVAREDFAARVEKLMAAIHPKIKTRGSVVFNINTIREGGRGVPGPNSTSKKSKLRVGSVWKKKPAKTLHDLPGMIMQIAERVGFIPRHEEIWVKKQCKHENVRDRSGQCHEYVVILDKSQKNSCDLGKLTANGLPNGTSVFECPTSRANYGHPATFHPALPERYIHAMTEPGDIVLDVTAGVCTTALSAMKHFRNSVSIELYNEYSETGISRLFHFARDYKAKLYKPAHFDLFADEEVTVPVNITKAEPLAIKLADSDYMANYHTIKTPEPLITHIKPQPTMKTSTPFPIESMTPIQQRLIEDLVKTSKANEIVAATSVLITWSAALGRNWTAFDPIRNDIDHPNLQGLVIAPTGTGKSVADKITKPLYAAEAIAHRLRKNDKTPPHRYLLDTVTYSALVRLLQRSDDTGFLFSSEAGGLINSILRKSRGSAGNLLDLILKGFSVGPHRDDTLKHDTRTLLPCLSQLLLAQPKVSRALIANADFIESGLANRWLMAEIPKPPLSYETNEIVQPNREAHRAWHKLILKAMRPRIIGSNKRVHHHVWSKAAVGVFLDYRNDLISKLKSEWSGHEDNLFDRSRELHKRIALGILAAEYYEGNEMLLKIDHNPALRAYDIIQWYDERRIEIMTTAEQHKATDLKRRILDILTSKKDHLITTRDLLRRHNISEEQAEEVAKLFPDIFEVTEIHASGGKAGRPSKILRLRF